jgi:orotate phosphoribosyltransferase
VNRAQLGRALGEHAYLEGDFLLRSGRRSSYYLDKYRFETQPDVLTELGKLFAEKAKAAQVDRIAGPELGAVALAAAASMFCGLPFVLVRNQKKGYGGDKLIEGVLKAGESVLIVEDILTTGGQVLEAAKVLTAAGAKVAGICGVIDRMEGARQNIESAGLKFDALFTTKDLGIEPGQ